MHKSQLILIVFIAVFFASCETTNLSIKDPVVEPPSSAIIEEEEIKIAKYGADGEVLSAKLNDKTYYLLGDKYIKDMDEDKIKGVSLVAPLRVSEESIKGNNGIVITYYDVKIFLAEKGGKVGLFEPQKNAWTIGDDIDRSQKIEIKLSDKSTGVISIGRSSISLSYR